MSKQIDVFTKEGAQSLLSTYNQISTNLTALQNQTNQLQTQMSDLGTQAILFSGAVKVGADADLPYVPAPDGSWAYSVPSRKIFRRLGGDWHLWGEGSVSPSQLSQIASTLKNSLSDLRSKSAIDGPQFASGSRFSWSPTIPGSLKSDSGSFREASDGGWWVRESNSYKLPEWYQCKPFYGENGEVPQNSGQELQNWINGAQIGQTLYADRVYYTDRTLSVNIDAVSIDWVGQLRPFGDFSGPLLKIEGNGVAKKQWGDNPWQMTSKIWSLNIDGLHQSKGVWFRNIDHFTIFGVHTRRTYGFGIRFDACREGTAYNCISMVSRQGPDKGVVEFLDTSEGADANNTLRIIGMHIIHNLGCHLYMDSPLGFKNGSICRLVDFFGLQVETISDQLDLVYTPEMLLGKFNPHTVYDPTIDLVQLKTVDSITFWGGHFFIAKTSIPQGGIAQGGAGIRLGSNAVVNGSSNTATNVRFNSVSAFVNIGDTDSRIIALHNTNQIKLDIHPMEGLNTVPLQWKSSSSSDVYIRKDKIWVEVEGGDSAFNALGHTGSNYSGAYRLTTGTGEAGQVYKLPSLMMIQPNLALPSHYMFRDDGALFVQGVGGQLGIPGLGFLSLNLESNNRSKRFSLTVGDDGNLYATIGTTTYKLNQVIV